MIHEPFVDNLRQRHIMIQLPTILLLIPVNIIASTIIVVFGVRLVPFIVTLNYILKIIIALITTPKMFRSPPKTPIDRIGSKMFRDSDLSFMYLFVTLLDALTCLISLAALLFTGLTWNPLILKPFRKTRYLRMVYLIYRFIQIYKAKDHFERFRAVIARTIPFLTALWSGIDVILDILQTRKYKLLSNCTPIEMRALMICASPICISPLFFKFSVASFVFPVNLCFIALLVNHKKVYFM